MKKFNTQKNLAIVVSERFKKSIEFAVFSTHNYHNSYPNSRYEKTFLGMLVTFNPQNSEVECFTISDFSDCDFEKTVEHKKNVVLNQPEYYRNEFITVIKASDFEYHGHVGYYSKQEQAQTELILQNKYMSLYIDIVTQVAEPQVVEGILISEFGLSIRTTNCLLRAGYETIEEVKQLTYSEIVKVRNLGRNSLEELEEKLGMKFI